MTQTHTYRPPINKTPTNSTTYYHKQQFYNLIILATKNRIIMLEEY